MKARMLMATMGLLGLAIVVAGVAGGNADERSVPPWPAEFDQRVQDAFALGSPDGEAPFVTVFTYSMTSLNDRRRADGAAVDHPGARSHHGSDVDAMEGFSRVAPVMAAWLAGGRPAVIEDFRGRRLDLVDALRSGLVAGSNPAGTGYWGDIGDNDQRLVESADIALALWLARDHVLPLLTDTERRHIFSWLRQVNGRAVRDSNWHLFPVLINEVLAALGEEADRALAAQHFQRFMEFYRGDGWFADGPRENAIDWYNAWGIHYALVWLRQISPGYGGEKAAEAIAAFAEGLPWFIGLHGVPIMGRSVCYRLAIPTPLVAAGVGLAEADVDPGLARHALTTVWRHFVRKNAFTDGIVSQGYCGTDLRLLDNYSGPASCHWSLRPLVFAFLAPPDAPFWQAPTRALPIERGDFERSIHATGWRITGDAASGDVQIFPGGDEAKTSAGPAELDDYGPFNRLVEDLIGRPFRPRNLKAKYALRVYSANAPFCGCKTTHVAP